MDDYQDIESQEGPDTDEQFDEQLQAAVAAELRDAIDFIDDEISPERAKALKYYKGEPFGTEEDGRSQVVSTDVRDTITQMLPPLMRIFAGAERVVEYAPRGPEDVQAAEQGTDAAHYIFFNENPGYMILYSAIKDALRGKTGVFKWWHEEKVDVTEYEYSGLDEGALALLQSDTDLEIIKVEAEMPEGMPPIDMAQAEQIAGNPQPMASPVSFEVKAKRVKKQLKYCVAAVPPEEFLIDRRARDEDTAALIGHRQSPTVSQLVEMGYDFDEVVQHAGTTDDELETNEERYRRNPSAYYPNDARSDDASRKVLYVEAYLRYDRDGDGIAELLKVCCMGTAYKVVHVESVAEVPFAMICPDPEPHTAIGGSVADRTMDVQEIKSEVMRGTLDSLAQAIHPRTGIVEGQVNIDDVLNNETGAVIRMRAPGMVQPFAMPFVGQQAFPVLEYMDAVKEARTGVTKAAVGLDADSLQSTTKAAVSATISAAQAQVELIARTFAETGIKRLFRGLLKMFVAHQDRPRMMRLRGKWVEVDPRSWNADMDVEINIALSASSIQDRLATLQMVNQKQEQILLQLGPQNPLVTMAQYRDTIAKMIELSGFKNTEAFFLSVDPNWQPPQEQPKQTPEEMLAGVQAQSIQADIQKKAAELDLKREEMILADDRERDRIATERFVKLREIELKYGAVINEQALNAEIERDRMTGEQILAHKQQQEQAAMQAQQAQQAAMQAQQQQQPQPPEIQ